MSDMKREAKTAQDYLKAITDYDESLQAMSRPLPPSTDAAYIADKFEARTEGRPAPLSFEEAKFKCDHLRQKVELARTAWEYRRAAIQDRQTKWVILFTVLITIATVTQAIAMVLPMLRH